MLSLDRFARLFLGQPMLIQCIELALLGWTLGWVSDKLGVDNA